MPNYGAKQAADCIKTPAGFYTEQAGSADFITNLCPPGHFCPQETDDSKKEFCEAGTFRRTEGGTAQADCGDCPSGYYCPEASSEPMTCPRGYYCPEK